MPDEIFAPHLRAAWLQQWSLGEDVEFDEYLEAAFRYATSSNGVVAFKIHWMHVADVAAEIGCATDDVLSSILPGARFINIMRRDRRAQALSWFRAEETNEWFRFDDGVPSVPAPRLDLDAVRSFEAHIDYQEASWHRYFGSRGIVPLTIEYEALAVDYRREVARALEFLGLDAAVAEAIPQPRRMRQADGLTASWRRELDQAADGSS